MLEISRLHKVIVVLGLIQATLLLIDVGAYVMTGTYLSNYGSLFIIGRAPWLLTWFNPWRWALLFTIRKIDVKTNLVLSMFLGTAALWVVISLSYAFKPKQVWWWLIVMTLIGFWYFPLGAWLGIVEIVLLSSYRVLAAQN